MTQKTNTTPFPGSGSTASQPASGGSLLSRPTANASNRPAAPTPPGASSRFGQSSNRLPATPPPSRFGQSRTEWEILPIGDVMVRFSLDGLGGSLGRLTGLELGSGTYQATLSSLGEDHAALVKLTQALDEAWEAYTLTGALLMYYQHEETSSILLETSKVTGEKGIYLRALDPLLVLNVLARTRSNLLQPRAPLSFDESQLQRTLLSDDPRLISIVQDGGYFEEVIPPKNESAEEKDE